MATILIIDDDAALRASMRKILERSGHAILDAEDGEMGIRLFREHGADLVVTDLFMPEKEGIETIQELKEESPELRILAVSGGASLGPGGPLTDAELLGADRTLAKPFTVEEFRDAVEGLLGADDA